MDSDDMTQITSAKLAEKLSVSLKAVHGWLQEGMPTNVNATEGEVTHDLELSMYWVVGHRFNKKEHLNAIDLMAAQKIAIGWLEGPCLEGGSRKDDLARYVAMLERAGISIREALDAQRTAILCAYPNAA